MKCGSQMAVALVGGYMLGRSHKTQLAVLLALLAAAGGKLPIDPSELLRHTSLGAPLDKLTGDLRSQLVESGMAVAKKAASNRIDSLSDKLQQRADTLRPPGARKGEEPGEAEEPEEPARRERVREEPARRERAREPEREEASDAYDEYEGDEYEHGEPEPELGEPELERDYREERRPPPRPTRSEPRRRAPRRDDDRPKTGRAPR
jgi:hypothetical protein